MEGSFLLQSVIYLSAAILCVPLAKRFAMGSVLGYLIAGILIGPFVLGFIDKQGKDIMHFAEFGVVVMLFLIGLELNPEKLWKIRKQILGVGLAQVLVTSMVLFGIGLLFPVTWQSALAVAMSLSMSSTAIVLQSLKEKGQMNSSAGQNSFAVLLFQDIAVIPILAILPLLIFIPVQDISPDGHSMMEGMAGWAQTLFVLAAVALIIVVGRYAIVPLLNIVAKTKLRELFTASALLIVVAIAYVMEQVGMSPALGTFLAGVILANSEYKHELESDLEPFKGLLLGLFFMAVGASVNFHLIASFPLLILSLTIGIVFIKALVLFVIGKSSKLLTGQNFLFALGLSQVGEFAFVLFSYISQNRILSHEQTDIMMAVTALTMTITPVLMLLNEKVIMPLTDKNASEEREADRIEDKHKVIIVGFSHFGSTIGRFLRANGVEATILDNNSDQVDFLRKMGFKVYYGDATRVELLESAGAEDARILITAIDSPETNQELFKIVRKHFPHLEVMIRSKNRFDAYEFIDLGATNIYREHLDTSIRMGVDVLKKLGFRSYSATRSGQNFIKYDEAALWKLAEHRHDMKEYIWNVKKQIQHQEELLSADKQHNPSANDHAWDSEEMMNAVKKMSS